MSKIKINEIDLIISNIDNVIEKSKNYEVLDQMRMILIKAKKEAEEEKQRKIAHTNINQ